VVNVVGPFLLPVSLEFVLKCNVASANAVEQAAGQPLSVSCSFLFVKGSTESSFAKFSRSVSRTEFFIAFVTIGGFGEMTKRRHPLSNPF